MKVKELIEKLQKLDPELIVTVQDGADYASDWCAIDEVEVPTEKRNIGSVQLSGWTIYAPAKYPLTVEQVPYGWLLSSRLRRRESLICATCGQSIHGSQEYLSNWATDKHVHNERFCYESIVN